MPGTLYLIPTYLSSGNDPSFLAPMVSDILRNTSHLLVENVRTARRFISSLKADIVIDELEFEVLDKKMTWDNLYEHFSPAREGKDMAVMSEAGLPCLADPGNLAVSFAHQTGIRVVPLPGASSIQLALIASGFNGQQFTFHGYLPIDRNEQVKRIREIEAASRKGYTQLFMETPYRNIKLLESICKTCHPNTALSIAADITGENEWICTQSVEKWKKAKVNIHKVPAIFSLGQMA